MAALRKRKVNDPRQLDLIEQVDAFEQKKREGFADAEIKRMLDEAFRTA